MRYNKTVLPLLIMSMGIMIGVAAPHIAFATQPIAQVPDAGPNGGDAGNASTGGTGPVRMVRFSFVNGDVRWRPDDSTDWTQAAINLPIREQSQIVVAEGGRAELQFDDGSMLRLDAGSTATVQTLFSDANGEFTEINLKGGTGTLRLMNDHSMYQVDMPFVAAKAYGPAKIRLDAHETVDVGVKDGVAQVEGQQGKTALNASAFLVVQNATDPFNVSPLPADDEWEQWNAERDQHLDEVSARTREDLPPNMAIAAPTLNDYGDWHQVPVYGHVWVPRVAPGWRPYFAGHWVWADPYGWTWVSAEEWGWVPYHYGTWVNTPDGWAWVPGPACQCWSPAVVSFSEVDGSVVWVPLAPTEVRYPAAFVVGILGRAWIESFSVGLCGVYYPADAHYCYARSWSNVYVNSYRSVTVVHSNINVTIVNRNAYTSVAFVPRNARFGGASIASYAAMRSGSNYSALTAARYGALHPHTVGAPPTGARPVAGPAQLKPTLASVSPTRRFGSGGSSAISRSVYRAAVPSAVARATGSGAVRSGSVGSTAKTGLQYGGTSNRYGGSTYGGANSNRPNTGTYGGTSNRTAGGTYGGTGNARSGGSYTAPNNRYGGGTRNRTANGTYTAPNNRYSNGTVTGSGNRYGGSYTAPNNRYGGTYTGSNNRSASGTYTAPSNSRPNTVTAPNNIRAGSIYGGPGKVRTGGTYIAPNNSRPNTVTAPNNTRAGSTFTGSSSVRSGSTYTAPNNVRAGGTSTVRSPVRTGGGTVGNTRPVPAPANPPAANTKKKPR